MSKTRRSTWHPGLRAGFLTGALIGALTVSKVWSADEPLPRAAAA